MLALLLVDHRFMTASACRAASPRGADRSAVTGTARGQLRLIRLGRAHWPGGPESAARPGRGRAGRARSSGCRSDR